MEAPEGKILYETHKQLEAVKGYVSDKHFKELTGNKDLYEMDELSAQKLLKHLGAIAGVGSLLHLVIEQFFINSPYIDEDKIANDLLPQLLDVISRKAQK